MLLAHESWFVNEAFQMTPLTRDRVFSFVTRANMIIAAIAAVILIVLIIEERRVRRERWRSVFAPYVKYAPTVVGVATGIALVLIGFLYGGLLAPNMRAVNVDTQIYMVLVFPLVLFVAAAFLLGILVRPAAVVLLVLYAIIPKLFKYEFLHRMSGLMLENLYWIGLAFFLLVVGRGEFSLGKFLSKFFSIGNDHLVGPVTLIFRILLGATFVFLGIQKMLHPELHEALIAAYSFNPLAIVREALPWTSTNAYVFAVGTGEILAGLLVVLGIFLRSVSAFLAFLFVVSAIFLGPKEMIGHLPIIGSLLAFMIMGRDGMLPHERTT